MEYVYYTSFKNNVKIVLPTRMKNFMRGVARFAWNLPQKFPQLWGRLYVFKINKFKNPYFTGF